MTFTEQWFGEASQKVLVSLAGVVADVPGMVVEIGAWEGRSTVALANGIAPRVLHSVDTWQGSPGEPSAELAATRDVYAAWCDNVSALTAGNVVAHRMGWRDFVADLAEPVAFCFIDAEHSYREVFDNITAVLPLLSPGAIICGDDQHHGPVRAAVADALPSKEVYIDETLWWWRKPVSTLDAAYGEMCRTPSDIVSHLPRFVQMVRDLNAEHVIELGTRTGVSTVAWLYGLERTGGRLTSVDIDARPEIGDYDHWTFIRGDDLDPEVVARLAPADIVFIDTSHHYRHTLAELHTYRWLVKPGGFLVLHDTELAEPEGAPPSDPRFPVRRAIEDFVAEVGWRWVNVPECWGLGVIRVP